MSSDVLIEVRNLGKKYELFDRPADRLKQLLWGKWRNYGYSFWALQDVSFSLSKGEVLGLVGRNGAGKSTLLQMICGTVQPSVGELTVRGRIAALLELGAGFNPDFTGIENVYLSATLLGFSRQQVEQKLDAILSFADIGAFVHQPVKSYSSGMFVRLAFSVATSLDPEILVIDEALSVGDGAFARKSFDRVMQMRENGAAVLFCSHSMYHIQAMCQRALWLDGGKVRLHDSAAKVISAYETALVSESLANKATGAQDAWSQQAESKTDLSSTDAPVAHTTQSVAATKTGRILAIEAWTDDGQTGHELAIQSQQTSVHVRTRFICDPLLPAPSLAFGIGHMSGVTVTSGLSHMDSELTVSRDQQGRGEMTLVLKKLPLFQGDYHLSMVLGCERGLYVYDMAEHAITLHVSQSGLSKGWLAIPHQWVQGLCEPTLSDSDTLTTVTTAHPPVLRPGQWPIVTLDQSHAVEVCGLFAQVFRHEMAVELHAWKYDQGRGLALGMRNQEGLLVAHYGATVRPLQWRQMQALGMQIGDVMVASEIRDVFAKFGPFGRLARAFIQKYLGSDKPYVMGYGFPNARHARLGQRLHLYFPLCSVDAWHWSQEAIGRLQQSAPLAEAHLYQKLDLNHELDRGWLVPLSNQMQQDVAHQSLLAPVRSVEWWQHRYTNHPHHQYHVHLVLSADGTKAVGALVLKIPAAPDCVELMDWMGPLSFTVQVLQHAAAICHTQKKCHSLMLWSSECVSARLDAAWRECPGARSVACQAMSTHERVFDHPVAQWQQSFWLTGGDTDFH